MEVLTARVANMSGGIFELCIRRILSAKQLLLKSDSVCRSCAYVHARASEVSSYSSACKVVRHCYNTFFVVAVYMGDSDLSLTVHSEVDT